MKNIQNVEITNLQGNLNTPLSKSADIISTRQLILNLNDSIITRKSKEYNFDFNNACSYDDVNQTTSGLLKKNDDNLFYFESNINEKLKEQKFSERKTSFTLNTYKNDLLVDSDAHKEKDLKTIESNKEFTNLFNNNYEDFNNIKKILKSNETKSIQNLNNIKRNSNTDAFKTLKERLKKIQHNKNFEFFEANSQKKFYIENDNPNVFFE